MAGGGGGVIFLDGRVGFVVWEMADYPLFTIFIFVVQYFIFIV